MAWPVALAAIGAAGAQMGNNMLNWTMNKKAAKTAFNRQRELYMLDYDLHKPSMQMKLLKEANLNPNLVYGGGNPGDVSVHMPSVDAASSVGGMSPVTAAINGLNAYNDAKLQEQNVLNAEATRKEIDSRTQLNQIKKLNSTVDFLDRYHYGAGTNASVPTKVLGLIYRGVNQSANWVKDLFKKDDKKSSVPADRKSVSSSVPSATTPSFYDYLYDGRKNASGVHLSFPYRPHSMGGYY